MSGVFPISGLPWSGDGECQAVRLDVDEEPFAVGRKAATCELGLVTGIAGEGVDLALWSDASDVRVGGEGGIDEVFANHDATPWGGAEVVAIGEKVIFLRLQEEREGVGLFGGAGCLEAEKPRSSA